MKVLYIVFVKFAREGLGIRDWGLGKMISEFALYLYDDGTRKRVSYNALYKPNEIQTFPERASRVSYSALPGFDVTDERLFCCMQCPYPLINTKPALHTECGRSITYYNLP